jgi:hypothetical protein
MVAPAGTAAPLKTNVCCCGVGAIYVVSLEVTAAGTVPEFAAQSFEIPTAVGVRLAEFVGTPPVSVFHASACTSIPEIVDPVGNPAPPPNPKLKNR